MLRTKAVEVVNGGVDAVEDDDGDVVVVAAVGYDGGDYCLDCFVARWTI